MKKTYKKIGNSMYDEICLSQFAFFRGLEAFWDEIHVNVTRKVLKRHESRLKFSRVNRWLDRAENFKGKA